MDTGAKSNKSKGMKKARSEAEIKLAQESIVHAVRPMVSLHESRSVSCLPLREEGSVLDHTNTPHTWKASYAKPKRSVQVAREPPFDVHPRFRGADFKSKEEVDAAKQEQVLAEENSLEKYGLEDEDFLRLDQSKVPLEFWDEYIEKYTPEEWVTKCKSGKSPFFADGEWSWKRCDVLNYNPDKQSFEVQFIGKEKTKLVKRLNLMFEIENEDAFKKRVADCHALREQSKGLIRMEYFISRQDTKDIIPLSEPTWDSIYTYATSTIRKKSKEEKLEAYQSKEPEILRELIDEIDVAYISTMQKVIVMESMKNNNSLRRRLEELRMPHFPPSPPAPEFGKIHITTERSAFKQVHDSISRNHFSGTNGLAITVSWLEDTWRDEFSQLTFVDTSANPKECRANSLEVFVDTQNVFVARVADKLQRIWWQGVVNQMQDNLVNDFNFYETNFEAVKESKIIGLLLRFKIQMSNQLKDIVIRSLNAWVEYFRSNSIAGSSESDFSRTSFLKLTLCEAKCAVVVAPSLDEVADGLLSIFDSMVERVRGFCSVDHEILAIHELDPEPLLHIGTVQDNPSVIEVNEALSFARDTLKEIIRGDFKHIQNVADIYNGTKQLVLEDPVEHVTAFVQPRMVSKRSLVPKTAEISEKNESTEEAKDDEKEEEVEVDDDEMILIPRTIDEFSEEISQYFGLSEEIYSASYNEESRGTIEVHCDQVKGLLSTRGKSFVEAYATHILETERLNAGELTEKYQSILKRIANKPKNEMELVALEEFIEDAKVQMVLLAEAVQKVHCWMSLLESYQFPVPQSDHHLFWSLRLWPNRISATEAATMRALEVDKIMMIDALAKEKEAFEKTLDLLAIQEERFEKHDDYEKLQDIVQEAYEIEEKINSAKDQVANFNMRDKAFNFDCGDYPTLEIVKKRFEPYFNLWSMSADFISHTSEWLTGSFIEIDGDSVDKQVTEWWTQSYRMMKVFGQDNEGAAAIAARLREDSDSFKSYLPVVRALASPALRDRHWEALSELIEEEVTPDESLTLRKLLDLNIMDRMEEVETITVKAEKEFSLEKSIEGMGSEWSEIVFDTMAYKETGTYVVKGTDDVMSLLDDHIVKIQTMVGSPYIKPIKSKAMVWEQRLQYIQSLIDEILKCQRAWMYLEPIFGSEDIMRQMPTEGRRFAAVDATWRKVLNKVHDVPSVMEITSDETLVPKFRAANEKLEQIQKGLNDYLEVKRMAFARFFFLSNDELLEIVSQTKDPEAVQPFLGKCFEGVGNVCFGKDMPGAQEQPTAITPFVKSGPTDLRIPRMVSNEGEIIELSVVVDPDSGVNKGNVEMWLGDFELSMRITVKDIIEMAAKVYPKMDADLNANPDRAKWVLQWPGQVVLNAGQLFWTEEVTKAIEQGKLSHYTEQLNKQLLQIVYSVRGKLNKMERTTLGALSVIDVHQRDVVEEMAKEQISDPNAFEWLAQLRYYWEHQEDDFNRYGKNPMNMMVRILNASQMYAYEYLGNSSRLIITPLTDRCYRTLMGAVSLLYGGAPAGPAGTGKTETTKDLSKAIAKQCVVFNCSDGLDYLAMAKFFKGISQAGAWACFDEFNRIELEVLSVIAQQILTIVNAKRARLKRFDFEGSTLSLNPDANCFITMNPGYAGRQELPDNLQALFRPCAMMVPDYALIAEIKLFSFGFEDNRNLARKLTQVLTLCSEQLSSQKHYDYGMRAVFSILVRAGVLRQSLGDVWTESMIVLSAITDVNLPKFNTSDIPLFKGITSDLFPGVELPTPDYKVLYEAILAVCEEDNLQPTESFLRAVIQLYETVCVRHGLMVVGETLSGKTMVTHTLAKAMSRIKDLPEFEGKVKIHTVNPKSITQGQLYGRFDDNTHEWTDGILAITYRNAAKDTSTDRQWVMFDGPVDAVWIEDMNTVLDDNKKLCLQSGEIVKMSSRMTMMFEPEDLEVASPATVSRVGMVFLEQSRLGWRPLVKSWVNKLPELLIEAGGQQEVIELFESYFEPMVDFLRNNCSIPTPVTDSELCAATLRLMNSTMLDPFQIEPDKKKDYPKEPLRVVEGCFILSLIWSIGGVTISAGQRLLDPYFKRLITGTLHDNKAWNLFCLKNPSYKDRMDAPRPLLTPMPFENGLIFDYVFFADKCSWTSWAEITPRFVPPAGVTYQDILIPTVDTTRNEWLIQQLVTHNHAVLVTGQTGTGKTVSLFKVLTKEIDQNRYRTLFLNFSAQTSANQTQDIIDGKLDKRRKGVFGPPVGKRLVVMVDDLNMPAKETYGAQPPIEILRQYMDHQGWYDRKEISFRKLVDIQFCAAMGPPGGGRSQITQRYVRHFSMVNMVPFDSESLSVIFGTIMEWFTKPFGPKIKALAAGLVAATISLYSQIEEEMLPTPAKSHYTFNLRDLSKVFQGICMGHPDRIKEGNDLIKLWGHECTRVFHDRLINDDDRTWFFDTVAHKANEYFKADWKKIIPQGRPLIYGNFMDATQLVENRVYDELDDMVKLKQVMQAYLDDYNNMSSKKMNLVLFMNAIEHVARIVRVLCQPQGNALLVGVGGSGRKSLTTLAVSLNEQVLFQIEISRVYGMVEWRDDLKRLLMMAGVEGKSTVFLFSDTQVVKEGFVEDINNILNTGEVPNLFNIEEQSAIVEGCRPCAEKEGLDLNTPAEVLQYFIRRCRKNLHVVLAFSPVGEAFRDRLRQFPSLVNCCAIDWFAEWPMEALLSVANHFLREVDMDEATKKGVVDVCVDMQQRTAKTAVRFYDEMRRYYYVTPTSYLELISTFKTLVGKQQNSISTKKARYANGLQKLQETADQVATMQNELEALQPKLVVAQAETEEKLKTVQEKQAEADVQKRLVEKDEAAAKTQAASCEKDKAECEGMLAEAIPALEGAVKALATLSKSDIVEVKAMKKPPPGVKITLEAVCIMMKVKPKKIPNPDGKGKVDDYWDSAQKELLNDPKFLQRLMDYDKDNISDEVINKVRPFCERDDFTPDIVKKASVAAASLCKWVHAMNVYERIARVVAPKRAALAKANKELSEAMEMLRQKQAELKQVLDNLAKLEAELKETMDFKDALENQVKDCATKLDRASRLIGGLGGEKNRWTQFVADLGVQYDNCVGDILLSSGVIAYLGVFTSKYREDCIEEWSQQLGHSKIKATAPFLLNNILGDAVQIRKWTICKLPNDNFSIDNAIMLHSSNRWPLMIDPQGQANKWIRNIEADNKLKVVKQSQNDFVRNIENAITFGLPVLLENVPETIDPILETILTKQIVNKGGSMTIQLGDNIVEYDPKFRLYITTKLSNPHYPPETCVKVNLLNFMATQEGLQDQMLGITVKRETPELEKQREQLVIEDAENKKTLKEIEDKILELLAKAEGNILDDEVLIATLGDSKVTSDQIMKQVAIAERTSIKIQATREGYVPVAVVSSNLFFCVADLALVDPMYQFSLEWYSGLYNMAIERAPAGKNLQERLSNLNTAFAEILYQNVCRSLFEKDKLLFSFLLCIKLLRIRDDIDTAELRFFLTGSSAVELSRPNPSADNGGWLNDKSWGDFLGVDELPAFEHFSSQVERMEELEFWKSTFNSSDPAKSIDEKFKSRFNTFQKLILLRCIRPDKVVPAVMMYIMEKIGQTFIEPPPFDLLAGYKDSTCTTPILFVLTPGADPMTELLRVANDLGMGSSLFAVSLGQGQGPIAERAVAEAVDKGSWVCLQNCHVAASWLPTLEKICEEFSPETVHESFRLWLTAMPCKEFPVSVLQNGVKITLEPPRGFRANMTGSYISMDKDWFESCPKPKEFKKLAFGICFFHALVRERCKFGPLGWNIKYTFSNPDLRITLDQLMLFLIDYDDIPFKMLAYLAGECNYGGRVTDDKDRGCLMNILSDFYTPEILDDDYKFSPSGTYYAPKEGNMQSYLDYIKSLPFSEEPEIFGLHENADITSAIQSTNSLLGTALALQPRTTGGEGKSWDEALMELASDIQSKIPPLFDLETANVMYPVKFEEAMNTVLVQELGRFNKMLQVIIKSLKDVKLAIQGLVVMSRDLENLGNSMTNMLLPEMWSAAAYPSLKPLGSWVTDLVARVQFLQNWLDNGKPSVYWISGFYFIPGFLTGTRQNYARKYTIPIDLIQYTFHVCTQEEGDGIDQPAEDGAYITGLFLEGAGWNEMNGSLAESKPKELFVQMPVIKLIPTKTSDIKQNEDIYVCPVYKTSIRFGMLSTTGHSTNFVLHINLPLSEFKSKHYIKRAVAMLCSLDT